MEVVEACKEDVIFPWEQIEFIDTAMCFPVQVLDNDVRQADIGERWADSVEVAFRADHIRIKAKSTPKLDSHVKSNSNSKSRCATNT